MRGSNTCELVFEDCEVPFENVLGEEGRGVRDPDVRPRLRARGAVRADPVGIMAGLRSTWSCPTAMSASSSASRIGEFQLMQGKLADMYTTLNACRAYVYAVARPRPRRGPRARTRRGHSLHGREGDAGGARGDPGAGGNGYINDYPTGRLLRDAKLYEIGAGTSEIRRMLIGRELFGETA
jgi:isovaleryl-CoA dehydrogenase